jgi:hypothetical protein
VSFSTPVYLRSEVVDQFGHLAVPMDHVNMSLIASTPNAEYLILSCKDCRPKSTSPGVQLNEESSKAKSSTRSSKKLKQKKLTDSSSIEKSVVGPSLSEYYVICVPKSDMDMLKKEGMMFKNVSTVSDYKQQISLR